MYSRGGAGSSVAVLGCRAAGLGWLHLGRVQQAWERAGCVLRGPFQNPCKPQGWPQKLSPRLCLAAHACWQPRGRRVAQFPFLPGTPYSIPNAYEPGSPSSFFHALHFFLGANPRTRSVRTLLFWPGAL